MNIISRKKINATKNIDVMCTDCNNNRCNQGFMVLLHCLQMIPNFQPELSNHYYCLHKIYTAANITINFASQKIQMYTAAQVHST